MEKQVRFLAKLIARIFIGTDDPEIAKKKGLKMAILIPAVRWMDWLLMGMTATLVAFLRYNQISEYIIFLILWIGNMAVSGAVVAANDLTKVDITLMEALRRWIDEAINRSKIGGLVLEGIILIRLILWDGPDQFIIFFRRRLDAKLAQVAVFVVASALQMAAWTALYVAGYDSFLEIFRR